MKLCLLCNREIKNKYPGRLFCSNRCRASYYSNLNKKEKKCCYCGKSVMVIRSRYDSWMCCSRDCRNKFILSNKIIQKCYTCGKEFYVTQSDIKRNKKYCSHKCYGKILSKMYLKSGNPQWKDGRSLKNKRIMDARYKEWVKLVNIKCHNTCQSCGVQRHRFNHGMSRKNINLNAHHIKPWSLFPDLRYDVDNGILLCHKCHDNAHNKGESLYLYCKICNRRFKVQAYDKKRGRKYCSHKCYVNDLRQINS